MNFQGISVLILATAVAVLIVSPVVGSILTGKSMQEYGVEALSNVASAVVGVLAGFIVGQQRI